MKIVVLNGSPKGETSVTRQYIRFLEKTYPQHRFVSLPVAQRVKTLDREPAELEKVLEEVRGADGVIWAFPLYILLVCSQYKRFIELIEERGARGAFEGKHACTLSTSIHFFDSTAHAYMRGVIEDLGMWFTGFYSAEMQDLLKADERRRLSLFARDFFDSIEGRAEPPRTSPVLPKEWGCTYGPATLPAKRSPTEGKKIVILTDALPGQKNLNAMTERLRQAWDGEVSTVNLRELDIAGGCQGCMRCGADFRCAYTGKDGFIEFFTSELMTADILVFAGAVSARQLSWKWREFFDRSFFHTHTPSLSGKQLAFLISGPRAAVADMREAYDGWAEFQRLNLAAFLCDDVAEPEILDRELDRLAGRLVRLSGAGYVAPRTFLGVGGMKIFRDEIWSQLKVVFRADHKAYRKLGFYDFPQQRIGMRILMRLAWMLVGLPFIKSRFYAATRTNMIMPMRAAALAAGAGAGPAAEG